MNILHTKPINQLQKGEIINTPKGQAEVVSVIRGNDDKLPTIELQTKDGKRAVMGYKYGNQLIAVVGNAPQTNLFQ